MTDPKDTSDAVAAAPEPPEETVTPQDPATVTDADLAAVPTDDDDGETWDEAAPDDSNQTGGAVL